MDRHIPPVERRFVVSHRLVLGIAVPMMVAYLTTPLIGVVDTAVVGQFGDAALIGGLAAGAIIFDLVFATFNFLRSGTTGLVAQAMGRGDALETLRDAIAALRRDAAELLAAAGHAAGDAVLERIETSLQALASDPGALAALGEGRLARDLEPPGFDALAGLAAGLAPVTRPARPEPAAPSAPPAKAPPVHAPPPRIPVASRSEADERAAEEAAPAAAPTKEMSAAKRRELQAIADEETGREATARRAERARRLAQARKDHAEAKRTLEQAEKRARAHAEELQEVEQRAARMRRAAQAAEAAATQAEEAAAEARAGARQALERLERAREALATAEAKLRDDDPQPM